MAARVAKVVNAMTPSQKAALSGPMRSLADLGNNWGKIGPALQKVASGKVSPRTAGGGAPSRASGANPVLTSAGRGGGGGATASAFTSPPSGAAFPLSNPSLDNAFTAFAGFTQSEIGSTRCGGVLVEGFNDSASFLTTLYSGPGGVSFDGVSRYTGVGPNFFVDEGYLNPGSSPSDFLLGDPTLGCVPGSNTVYYSSLFSNGIYDGASVSTSTDGAV